MQRALERPMILLRFAGALAWLAVGVPILAKLRESLAQGSADGPKTALAAGALVVFGIASRAFAPRGAQPRRRGLALATLMSLCAIVIPWAHYWQGTNVGLLVMVAVQLAGLMPRAAALAWIAAQTLLALGPWFSSRPLDASIAAMAYLGFQAFALAAMAATEDERRAREELARVNSELRAMQSLLADRSRTEERLRIARELHDSLGHKLTALALHLELASHKVTGEGLDPVMRTRALSKELLADVRATVGTLRDEPPLDLVASLRALAGEVTVPRIHLDVAEELCAEPPDPERALTVLRCVQEIVTNAVRHAGAENLWIAVARKDGALLVRSRDDGRGAGEIRPGHGLRGMRERLEQAGGRLEVSARPGRGFEVVASLPGAPG